ncbi:MAG: putative toxin-antitoxin system toxin component, PIN family [Verrucomicrobiota bacterium]|jgi:putative PIN family toxin of toxin-antitoxin system
MLDSNVWLAILTTDGFCRQLWRVARSKCQFIASQDILDEVSGKLRSKFGFSPRHTRLLTFFVERQTEFIQVTSTIAVCRDADDNCILAAALDSGCTHLITGDSDLLFLKKFEGIGIVTPREFLELVSTT